LLMSTRNGASRTTEPALPIDTVIQLDRSPTQINGSDILVARGRGELRPVHEGYPALTGTRIGSALHVSPLGHGVAEKVDAPNEL